MNKEKYINKDSRNNTNINDMSNPSVANQRNDMSISVDNYGNSSNLKKLNLFNNKELYTTPIPNPQSPFPIDILLNLIIVQFIYLIQLIISQ